MTVLEKKKFRLIREIMDDTDENRVSLIEKLYDKNPLSYSEDELRERVNEFEKEYISGDFKGIPHDEVMSEYGL